MRPKQARSSSSRSGHIQPASAALAAWKQGDAERAIAICRRRLRARHEDSATLHLMGILQAEAGKPEEALSHLRKAHEAAPSDIGIALSLGKVLGMDGARDEALNVLAQARALAPGRADIALAHADAMQQAGRSAAALCVYDEILGRDPDHLGALVHGGILLMKTGYSAQGAVRLRRAATRSANPVVLCNLAMAEAALGDLDAARDLLDRVLARDPGHVEALAGKVQLLHAQGRTEEALAAIQPYLTPETATPSVALSFARMAGKAGRLDEARTFLLGLLDRADLDVHAKRQLSYALGRVNDALARYDDAFAAFRAANDLTHRRYDPALVDSRFAALRAAFTEAALGHLPRSGIAGFTPVLIVGMPRSGTTLVEQILDSHPAVASGGEVAALGEITQRIAGGGRYPERVSAMTREELDRLAEDYRGALAQAAGREADLITDKMPANFEHLGLAGLMLPGARVIHCRRDPRDSGLSCYMQNFHHGNLFADDLAAIGHQAVACDRLMAHWRAVLPLPMLEIQYEALVCDLEPQVRRLLSFLELPWHPDCLAFHRNPRQVRTASFDQVRQPLYRNAVGRWRNYETHIGPLLSALDPILPAD